LSLNIHSLERHGAQEDAPPSRAHRLKRGSGLPRAHKLKSLVEASAARGRANTAAKSAVRTALATPGKIRRTYLRMLAPAHRLYRDRHIERLLFKPSSASQRDAASQTPETEIHQGPIPGQVFDWIIQDLDVTLRECAFVDFRAGNARTLLYAAMHDFERAIGYEYSDTAYDDAQLNVSQFPRTYMKCRDVEVRRGDRGDIVIPDQPLVLFFPNAANERFLSLMLDHVAASYRMNPRRIYLLMEGAEESLAAGWDDIFERTSSPAVTRLKLKLFSPVHIRVYRSLV